jgi:hypothetical protein
MSIRSVISVRAVSTNRSAKAFARVSGRDFHGLDAGGGEDRVERLRELPGAVADQEPEVRGAVSEVDQEVAGLLGGPRSIGIRGDPEDAHVPALAARRDRARGP